MLGTNHSCTGKDSCPVVDRSGVSALRGDIEQRSEQMSVVCSPWRGQHVQSHCDESVLGMLGGQQRARMMGPRKE